MISIERYRGQARVMCRKCHWEGLEGDLLVGKNPFAKEVKVYGCPACKWVDGCVGLCDYPGCKRRSKWVESTDKGLVYSCGDHTAIEIIEAIKEGKPAIFV